ncbi:hypothetical protein, partial [Burkholderia sp. ABCPW 14]|uniref:hypothetical protein n=1 Tax=Burkholderia sp. ABCPW 14 TaxID=1637860 RepID=UPI001E37CCEB
IHTSSGFAGFTRQYACFLQIQQHRFGITAFPYKPSRIVQVRLFIRYRLASTNLKRCRGSNCINPHSRASKRTIPAHQKTA